MPKIETTAEYDRSSRRLALGAVASGLVNIVKVGLQLLLLPLMARLLGPTEFGIYALALPTVSFVALLADGGLGATLAREPESRTLVWSSAFWFLLLSGLVLAVSASVFGLLLAHLVGQPRIAAMTATLSLSIILLVLAVPAGARLARRQHLAASALAELVANLAGAAAAIVFALRGFGAWSLVAQYLIIYTIRSAILNAAAFSLPGFEFSLDAVRTHLTSGGLLVMARLIDYGARAGESVLVQRFFGTPALGGYTFANQISKFSGEAIGNVTWAALYVQALTGNQPAIAEIHRKLCRLISVILFPVTFLAAVAAPELNAFLLGPKWAELTPLLQVLLPSAAFLTIANQITAILLAINRFEIAFWCAAGLNAGRLLAVLLGAWVGITGVAYGIGLVTLLYLTALLFFADQPTGCRPMALLRGLAGPFISSLAGAAGCYLCLRLYSTGVGSTIIALVGGTVIFIGFMLLLDRQGLIEDWKTARRVMAEQKIAYEQG
jgi:O-antigen/teichoic acid export membrane protein